MSDTQYNRHPEQRAAEVQSWGETLGTDHGLLSMGTYTHSHPMVGLHDLSANPDLEPVEHEHKAGEPESYSHFALNASPANDRTAARLKPKPKPKPDPEKENAKELIRLFRSKYKNAINRGDMATATLVMTWLVDRLERFCNS